jgi:hypothetical protein
VIEAPRHDTSTLQRIIVWAAPQTVYDALWTADLSTTAVARMLAEAAMVPERITAWARHEAAPPAVAHAARLPDMLAADSPWTLLADEPGHRVVLGLLWRVPGATEKVGASAFEAFSGPGIVKVTWSLSVEPFGAGHTLLVTETRARAMDELAARRFALVWPVLSPFAALLRRQVLHAVKDEAERVTSSQRVA